MEKNNLFYLCSLIEYIARYTSNTKKEIITKMSKELITHIYNLADIYHCENIEKIANEIMEKCHIEKGNYILKLQDGKPTYFDMGKVYQRIITMDNKADKMASVMEVLSSWLIEKMDNYSSSLYYENPNYIYECYKSGKIL